MFVTIAMAAAKENPVGVRLTRRDADPKNLGRLEALFDELDTNKDGVIDSSELIAGINRKGYTHITEEQIKVRDTKAGSGLFQICSLLILFLLRAASSTYHNELLSTLLGIL